MSDNARRQLLFEVGDNLFAVDASEVVEVLEPAEATPVPGAVAGVHGLINLRGTLVVSGEFGSILGVSPKRSEEAALVVFEREDRRVALVVDRVVGLTPSPEGDLEVSSELLRALGAGDVVLGVGHFGQRPYFRLEMGTVFGRVLEQDEDARVAQLGSTEGQGA